MMSSPYANPPTDSRGERLNRRRAKESELLYLILYRTGAELSSAGRLMVESYL